MCLASTATATAWASTCPPARVGSGPGPEECQAGAVHRATAAPLLYPLSALWDPRSGHGIRLLQPMMPQAATLHLICVSIHSCACVIVTKQKCPFEAIMIINLPKDLEKETTHRYGPNTFKLHRWVRLCWMWVWVCMWVWVWVGGWMGGNTQEDGGAACG